MITQYHNYSDCDIEKLKYGLEGIYLTITKIIIILAISFAIGILKETLIVLVLFNIIRYFGFGFHAAKSYQCLICSIFNFVCIPYIYMNSGISYWLMGIISILCIIILGIYAPADTVKRPLPNKKKRYIRKSLTVLTAIIYSSLIFILRNDYLSYLFISATTIQAIAVNPLTYMIFRQPYRNYKNYSDV